ncbi:MAG: pentapeptide repeat protein [Acidobacteriaceae bacterium]|nr:pentapeptide repeat protein [Acidobacteriaceae bacterium]
MPPERAKKQDRARELPRQIPSDPDTQGAEADLLEGGSLEDTAFSEIDLSGQRIPSLRGSNLLFDGVSFANCEIGSTRLSDARFVRCDLSNAQLRSFEATRVEFIDCKLVGVNALGCHWQDVLLDRCDARFAQLSDGRIRRSEIRGTQFREAALNQVDFESTRFNDVVLRQAELTRTRLAGLDLTTCDIEGITLQLEDLRGAIVSAAQAMQLARFLEVVIR